MKLNSLFENFSSHLHKAETDSSDADSDIITSQTTDAINNATTFDSLTEIFNYIVDKLHLTVEQSRVVISPNAMIDEYSYMTGDLNVVYGKDIINRTVYHIRMTSLEEELHHGMTFAKVHGTMSEKANVLKIPYDFLNEKYFKTGGVAVGSKMNIRLGFREKFVFVYPTIRNVNIIINKLLN